MKQVKKIVCALLMVALLLAMSVTAFASEDGSMWLRTTETSDSTNVLIVTDATVTDGLVEITYDSSVLTYESITVAEEYVAMYSVNAENPGSVKISWVAPNAYEFDGKAIILMQLIFSGTENKASFELNGTGSSESGNKVSVIDGSDATELKKAILVAEGLRELRYTEESFAAVMEALASAKNVFEDLFSTQQAIDDAAELLNKAIDDLVLIQTSSSNVNADTSELEKAIAKAEGLDESMYTKKSFKNVEKELKDAKSVLANRYATQDKVDAAAKELNDAIAALELLSEESNPSTGVESMMSTMIIVAVLSAAGIVIFGNKFMRRRAI